MPCTCIAYWFLAARACVGHMVARHAVIVMLVCTCYYKGVGVWIEAHEFAATVRCIQAWECLWFTGENSRSGRPKQHCWLASCSTADEKGRHSDDGALVYAQLQGGCPACWHRHCSLRAGRNDQRGLDQTRCRSHWRWHQCYSGTLPACLWRFFHRLPLKFARNKPISREQAHPLVTLSLSIAFLIWMDLVNKLQMAFWPGAKPRPWCYSWVLITPSNRLTTPLYHLGRDTVIVWGHVLLSHESGSQGSWIIPGIAPLHEYFSLAMFLNFDALCDAYITVFSAAAAFLACDTV